jgi:hypothetical protein
LRKRQLLCFAISAFISKNLRLAPPRRGAKILLQLHREGAKDARGREDIALRILAGFAPLRWKGLIVHGKRAITADTALRLGKYFTVSPEIWLDLQSDYELRVLRRTAWPMIEPRIRTIAA